MAQRGDPPPLRQYVAVRRSGGERTGRRPPAWRPRNGRLDALHQTFRIAERRCSHLEVIVFNRDLIGWSGSKHAGRASKLCRNTWTREATGPNAIRGGNGPARGGGGGISGTSVVAALLKPLAVRTADVFAR